MFLFNNKSLKELKAQMSDYEFNQWFSGFTDAEGTFQIRIHNNVISFNYSIGLHIDDQEALEFIKERLNCGSIYISGNKAIFYLTKLADLNNSLIPLLENFPLNGTKYLDYLAFKDAITIKLNKALSNDKKLELITDLKNSMNTKRVNFDMPSSHSINITLYYLLGLIEGEGTFCLNDAKNMGVSFSIALTSTQAPLIYAIKNFIDSYMIEDTNLKNSPYYLDIISQRSNISLKKKSTENGKPIIELTVRQVGYLMEYFIPMLSSLNFVTKKYYDFTDWKCIINLIYKGLHTTEIGKELILKISKGMNNYRLSTNNLLKDNLAIDISQSLIEEVLNLENVYIKNYEGLRINASTLALVKAQLFYIEVESPEGEIIIFKDTKSCAEYFGITSQTLNVAMFNKATLARKGSLDTKLKYKLTRKPL